MRRNGPRGPGALLIQEPWFEPEQAGPRQRTQRRLSRLLCTSRVPLPDWQRHKLEFNCHLVLRSNRTDAFVLLERSVPRGTPTQ
jgi:hypothetical protein